MYISSKDWQKFIKNLSIINKAAGDAMIKYIQQNGFTDTNALIEYGYNVAKVYGNASGALAAAMYDEISNLEGKFFEPAELADTPDYGEVAKAIHGSLKKSKNPREISGAVSRLVKRTGQDTLLKNGIRDRAEFAWIPSGDTCPFCITLASRGWQPISKKALKNGHAEHIHSNCDCSYMIRHDSSINVSGYNPDKYLAQYESAEGNTPAEKINSMRRMQYASRKDVINAQKRAAYAERRGNDLEKEESRKREKALEQTTRINKDAYAEKELRKFTDSLNESTNISREIYKNAKDMLDHRDGTFYEDLAFVDTVKEKSKINKDYDYYNPETKTSACKPSKPMRKMLSEADPYTIIGIHNHPKSYAPSDSDISRAHDRQYKYGLVFCHNGTKYKYYVHENYNAFNTHFSLANLEKAVYDKDAEKISKYLADLKESGVDMEVFL